VRATLVVARDLPFRLSAHNFSMSVKKVRTSRVLFFRVRTFSKKVRVSVAGFKAFVNPLYCAMVTGHCVHWFLQHVYIA
jgi:hypothetical protein